MKKIVGALSLIVIAAVFRGLPPAASREPLSPSPAKAGLANALDLEAPSRRGALSRAEAPRPEPHRESAVEFSAVAEDNLSPPARIARSLSTFHDDHFRLGGDSRNAALVQRLAAQEEIARLAATLLQDPRRARSAFGAEQATARVLAVQILGARAKAGDPRLLEETIFSLGKSFGGLDVGGKADFRDLVTELIGAMGPETFFADPAVLMSRFKNPAGLGAPVLTASVVFLGDRINDPEFTRKMKTWL